MGDNEDSLNRISRQLSEMGPVPHLDIESDETNSSHLMGNQWTQFNRMSAVNTRPASFQNIYTWNPLDLADSKPVSQHQSQEPQELSHMAGFRGYGQNPNAWSGSSHPFTTQSLPQRPLQDRSDHHGFEHSSAASYQMSAMNPHGENVTQPTRQFNMASNDYSRNQNVLPQLQPFLHRNPQSTRMHSHKSGSDRGLEGPTELLSTDHLSRTHSPPLFDPSTPPPMFMAQRQHSVNSVPSNMFPSQTSNDMEVFLQSQLAKSKLKIDLGTNITESPTRSFPDVEIKSSDDKEGTVLSKDTTEKPESTDPTGNLKTSKESNDLSGKPQESPVVDKSKPSYSDIAKTPKSVAQSAMSKAEQQNSDESAKVAAPSKQQKKDMKSFRPPIKRTSSGSKFLPRESSGIAKGSPASRYGLDDFNETAPVSPSSSSESLSYANRIRRDSGSSAGSSISALDDITFTSSSHPSTLDTSMAMKEKSTEQRATPPSSAKSVKTTKPSSTAAKPASAGKENVFFDPKRIFQSKSTGKSQASAGASKAKTNTGSNEPYVLSAGAFSSTLLNNGKPTAVGVSSKLPSSAKEHDYINNDLRDTSKVTNKTAEEIAHSGASVTEDQKYEKEHRSAKRSGTRTNGAFKKDKRKQGESGQGQAEGENGPHHQQDRPSLLFENLNTGVLEEWFAFLWEKLSLWGNIFIAWLLNFLIYGLGLILFLATSLVHLVLFVLSKGWALIKGKLLKGRFSFKEGGKWSGREYLRRRVGVEENIVLPATGDEAMKRLLACRGKDPYSILGLRADSSDEEIKKYYRKQAVLVHPDKNQEPGAEEAFKILGHAFEMIGDPSKRKQYDSHTQEEVEADAMREFADMLTKLQTKIQEAANIMRCDICGGKHQRVPVDRPFYSARFCQSCNVHHQAKEGDVWAESRMLGFYWHYYALMEGHVFDITEWMKCHRKCFQHMKANAHAVMYRIATDGNKKSKHHPPNDANLEEFFNRLFNKSGATGNGEHSAWNRPASSDRAWTTPGSGAATANASSTGKRSGRRKKRR
ncbi:Dnaj-like protein subfamily c member 14 [Plakobranchus ocellatus]|uniref:Dnaj-like protein subfamily c member 14 n=1 Tax=Plakobranchus ocellatus TaxID=259542 RepID=A0AAV4ACR8_9GAST|nr:Dnaj-like protein subfamily c member 14 [Plakobranchus ocellatus]